MSNYCCKLLIWVQSHQNCIQLSPEFSQGIYMAKTRSNRILHMIVQSVPVSRVLYSSAVSAIYSMHSSLSASVLLSVMNQSSTAILFRIEKNPLLSVERSPRSEEGGSDQQMTLFLNKAFSAKATQHNLKITI